MKNKNRELMKQKDFANFIRSRQVIALEMQIAIKSSSLSTTTAKFESST